MYARTEDRQPLNSRTSATALCRWCLLFLGGMITSVSVCTRQVSAQGSEGAVPAAAPTTGENAPQTEAEPTDLGRRKRGLDWPSFLGPERNGRSAEKGIIAPWPATGLRIVWQQELGESYGIGSVSRGRYVQFDRRGADAQVSCLHAETGETLWEFTYPSVYEDLYGYNAGPRCSPVIAGNRVFVFGVEGMLHCLRLTDGALLWKRDTAREFGVVQNFFGVGSTPIVEGDLLIAVVGGSPPEDQTIPPRQLDRVTGNGSGIVAWDIRTGALRYQITDELAAYACPTTATIDGRRWCFALCRGGLVGFDPGSGQVDFHYPWRATLLESVNASTPLIVGSEVFVSETYGPGSSMLRVKPGGYEVVWRDEMNRRQKALKMHWNTPIYHDGYLYGCSGRNSPDAELRCIEWRTGKVMWTVPTRTHIALMYVDGYLVGLEERGRLLLIRVNPQKLDLVSEFVPQAPLAASAGTGPSAPRLLQYPSWAAPILSHGLLYVRGRDRLICYELIPEP